MFCIHPQQNGYDLSITGHFLEVHVSEDDETCLYCRCDITRGQGVKACIIRVNSITHTRDNEYSVQRTKACEECELGEALW